VMFLKEGLKKIKEAKSKNKTDLEDIQSVNIRTKNKRWTHKSVKALMELSGNDDPLEEIKSRARGIVLKAFELGWEGPPYSPIRLAEILGINVSPNDSVIDACIIPQKKGFQIQYNPFQRPTRINFSISHEIAHT